MSMIKNFSVRTLLLGITVGTVLGVLVAPQFIALFGTSGSVCPAPMAVKLLTRNADSVKITWDLVPNVENYLVTVRDSATLSVSKAVYSVKGKEFTVPDLKANRGYRVDVQSLCERNDAGSSVSSAPTLLGVRTKGIITEEVVEFNGVKPCNKTNCDTGVPIDSLKCFNWSTGTVYYQMDITRNGALAPAAKVFFEKSVDATSGFLHIKYVKDLVCAPKVYSQNAPTDLNCKSTVVNVHLCGTLPYTPPTGGATITIPYRLEFTGSQCCVIFDDPAQAANYTVTVKKCTDVSTQ